MNPTQNNKPDRMLTPPLLLLISVNVAIIACLWMGLSGGPYGFYWIIGALMLMPVGKVSFFVYARQRERSRESKG